VKQEGIMNQSVQAAWRLFRMGAISLALAALLACVAGYAQTQPDPKKADPPFDVPLFNPLLVNPGPFGASTLAMGCTPQSGSWSFLSLVYAGEHPDLKVWSLQGPMSTQFGRYQLGGINGFLAGFSAPATAPWTELAVLQAGEFARCWQLINGDEVRSIPPSLLERVRDEHGLSLGTLEVDAFDEFVIQANYTSNAAFVRAARHDLLYAHLFTEPARYRGQVVYLEGRLKRLLRCDPSEGAAARGVNDVYEGWVFNDAWGANPFCIVFMEKPAALPLTEKMEQQVAFAGYFYKKLRYEAADSGPGKRRDAPMLIGHSVILRPNPPADAITDSAWVGDMLPLFVGGVALTAGGIAALAWYFRRSDHKVRQRLVAVRNDGFVLPAPGEAPETEAQPFESRLL
jgi:hypothetical protein